MISYLIQINESENGYSIENGNFYICSILVKHPDLFCKDETSKSYIESLINSCLKADKKNIKAIRKCTDTDNKVSLTPFYVEFLKTMVQNASKSLTQPEIESLKICKHILALYFNQQKLSLSMEHNEPLDHYLLRIVSTSMNSLKSEEFKEILEHVDSMLINSFDYNSANIGELLKVTKLLKYLCCDIELADQLKPDFSIYIQKFLVQMHPIYYHLKVSGRIKELIELVKAHGTICSSKYVSEAY